MISPEAGGVHTGNVNVTHKNISVNCSNPGATLSFHTYDETAHQDSNLQEVVSNIPGKKGFVESFHNAVTDSPLPSFLFFLFLRDQNYLYK